MKSFHKIITFLSISLVIVGMLFISCNKSSNTNSESKKIVVYAYDSFTSDWGPGPAIKEAFEKETGYELELISVGDAGSVLSRAQLEKNNPIADVLVGLDNHNAQEAETHALIEAYKPKGSDVISSDLHFSHFLENKKDWLITPYDWGYFSLIYDSHSSTPAPQSLADLTKDEYKNKLILMDPQTSTPGLGFVAWTLAVFGEEGFDAYWKALKPSILTLAPGWDSGYGLFTSGEAPLVLSYTISPAYHVEYENTDRYQALIFDEGHVMQVEGAALVKGAPNSKGGKAFIDFLISKEAQNIIPLTQWMYPVLDSLELPKSFDAAPKASKTLFVDAKKALKAAEKFPALLF